MAHGQVDLADTLFSAAAQRRDANEQVFLDWCNAHAARGDGAAAERVIRQGISRHPLSRELLLAYAALQRRFDRRDDAAAILGHLLKGSPNDPDALATAALVEFERGRDSLPLYDRAMAASPASRQICLGAAAALHAEGRIDEAIDLLSARVATNCDWIEGLRALARFRWERGDGEAFAEESRRAAVRDGGNAQSWAAYLGLLASSLKFERVVEELPVARKQIGDGPLLAMFEAQALSECDRNAEAETVFRALEPIADASFVPMRMRSLLRTGRAAEAARLGEQFRNSPHAAFIWPLLGLAWRIADDRQWEWLERFDSFTTATDIGLSKDELTEVASFVRSLHRDGKHPYDQSLRSGSQTLGNLFDRTDPPLIKLRDAIRETVRAFVDGLPPVEPEHPFLRRDRGPFYFAGSWSVRLKGEGFHVAHVHPMGWISSALYLSLPEFEPTATAVGSAAGHAGWLGLGGAPPELKLGLEPVRWIEPKPGRLALFPSIMWHETAPFRAGERLTVAFDVAPFR